MRPEVDRTMKAKATVVVVSALVTAAAVAASCGKPFSLSSDTGGTGGKGGAGGANAAESTATTTTTTATATSSPSSSSSGATASTGTGTSMDAGGCSFVSPDCGTKAFCQVDSCDEEGTGTCKSLPALDKDALKPLCGCDGNTYWSGVEAVEAQQPIAAMGECEKTATMCSTAAPCPTGAKCSKERQSCGDTQGANKCWVLPSTCTGHTEGGQSCVGNIVGDASLPCDSICKMISDGALWVSTPACPSL